GERADVFVETVSGDAVASSITWANLVNCTAAGSYLQKTGGLDQTDDAYATSAQGALDGDVYVEFTAEQNDKERWCGLNNSNPIHQSADDINFAIKLGSNKKALVVENGVTKAKIKYKPGNAFRVSVDSGVVNYYKNGSVFYTSTASPVYPLLVNASLVDTMSDISNAMILLTKPGPVISIRPAKVSTTPGSTVQFTAVLTGIKDTITWSATGGSISNTGLYIAPAPGSYVVTAACTSHPNIRASADVFVSANTDTTPPIISSVSSSSITASSATISWETNEPSDTQVEYGA